MHVTNIDAKSRALHVLLALPNKDKDKDGIKDKLLETVKVEDLKTDDGLGKLLLHMDKYLAKDLLAVKWEKFQDFEQCSKSDSESMTQYIASFDTLYQRLKSDMAELELPSSILAFKLLNGANLSEDQRMVVMTAMDFDKATELYDSATKALKKFFGGANSSLDGGAGNTVNIKTEPIFLTGASGSMGNSFRGRNRGKYSQNSQRQYSQNTTFVGGATGGTQAGGSSGRKQKDINPRGQDGKVLRCYRCDSYRHMGAGCPSGTNINSKGKDLKTLRCIVCESYRHLLSDCPHSWEAMAQINLVEENFSEEEFGFDIEPCTEPVVLFTRDSADLNLLSKESYFSGVLDSGCSSTVCGKKWLEVYLDRLPEQQRASVVKQPSSKVFQFGGELRVPSEGKVLLPGEIVGQPVLISTDIVDSNIPLLFSKDSLKSLKAKIDFETDEAVILGQPVTLNVTSVGHHCVSLLPEHIAEVKSVDHFDSLTPEGKYDMVLKLHRQYGHPGQLTFVKHLKSADMWDDVCSDHVKKIYDECDVCRQYARAPTRPVVSLPLASDFNEVVAVDLKYLKPNLWILHMIDVYSRFSQSVLITSKQPKVIIEAIIENWVGIFGVMGKGLISDNGGEFCNQSMRDMSSLLNFEVMTTGAYAPFQNGLCERNHAVIDMILFKLRADYPKTSLNILLKWANMAKNSLQMWTGYSSYQIVFGTNPKLPNVMTDRVPALESGKDNMSFNRHISALHTARQEFVKTESSERIKRALRSRVRASEKVFQTGDRVYYKRPGSVKWLGPARVIGQDGKVVFAIHGGHLVRVAATHLLAATGVPNDDQNSLLGVESESPKADTVTSSSAHYEVIDDATQLNAAVQIETEGTGEVDQENSGEINQENSGVVIQENSGARPVVSRALARLQDFNNPGFLELDNNPDLAEVNSVTIPSARHNDSECMEAKFHELERLRHFDVFEEVDDHGEMCISTKWVIVQKSIKVKARLVARGFEEDLVAAVYSPTVAKPCVRLVLAIAASQGWIIQSTDVKAAFLQGQLITRDVYLKPPKESETKQGKIWKLRRCLYGLNDAARQFYNSLSAELVAIGCVRNPLDPAFFTYFHNDRLSGVLVSHVDDFLHTGDDHFNENIMVKLYQRFTAGSREMTKFVYTGYQITQTSDSSIVLDQCDYANKIDVNKLEATKLVDKEAPLSYVDQSNYRALVGKLGWLVQGTRPDLAFQWLQASTKNNCATIKDLVSVNKIVLNAKVALGIIKFPNLGNQKYWKVIVYSDASLANLSDGTGSTGASVIFLVGENNHCCPLSWTSAKLRRVCRSSAAAEGLSLSEALDDAVYLRQLLCAALGLEKDTVPVIAYTDHEGLRANISNVVHPKVLDKRLKIEIACIRQSLAIGEVQDIIWCKSQGQLADCLTKAGASSVKLMKVLQTGLLI